MQYTIYFDTGTHKMVIETFNKEQDCIDYIEGREGFSYELTEPYLDMKTYSAQPGYKIGDLNG